jgi:glycosyltransferase involved in cell wall biosynthesis
MTSAERCSDRIDVLLATYNGATFLPEQLNSLFSQTNQAFQLVVRDDDSTDSTPDILREYATRYPNRITLLTNSQRLGPWRNFAKLLNDSTARYVMFCDQDDVWQPTKIETSLQAMRDIERKYGDATPALVCTDLRVVDQRLTTVMPSLWRNHSWRPTQFRLGPLLMMNKVSGCTVLVNRNLLNKVLPIDSDQPVLHDWWLAIAASCWGILQPVPQQTILYRQHAANAVGERQRARTANRNYLRVLQGPRLVDNLDVNREFAERFRSRYRDTLNHRSLRILNAFVQLPALPFIARKTAILRCGFFLPRLRQNIRLLLER